MNLITHTHSFQMNQLLDTILKDTLYKDYYKYWNDLTSDTHTGDPSQKEFLDLLRKLEIGFPQIAGHYAYIALHQLAKMQPDGIETCYYLDDSHPTFTWGEELGGHRLRGDLIHSYLTSIIAEHLYKDGAFILYIYAPIITPSPLNPYIQTEQIPTSWRPRTISYTQTSTNNTRILDYFRLEIGPLH